MSRQSPQLTSVGPGDGFDTSGESSEFCGPDGGDTPQISLTVTTFGHASLLLGVHDHQLAAWNIGGELGRVVKEESGSQERK